MIANSSKTNIKYEEALKNKEDQIFYRKLDLAQFKTKHNCFYTVPSTSSSEIVKTLTAKRLRPSHVHAQKHKTQLKNLKSIIQLWSSLTLICRRIKHK